MDEINAAWLRLNDAICEWERMTGMGHTLILIPQDKRAEPRMTMSGKPTPEGEGVYQVAAAGLSERM